MGHIRLPNRLFPLLLLTFSSVLFCPLSSCHKMPKLSTDEEILSYMKQLHGIDFVIRSSEDIETNPNVVAGRTYWVTPDDDSGMMVRVTESIRIETGLFPTDNPYSLIYTDTYVGDLFTSTLVEFLTNQGIKYTQDGQRCIIISLEPGTLPEQVTEICRYTESLNDQSCFNSQGARQAIASIIFQCGDVEVHCFPFKNYEPPYIEIDQEYIIGKLEDMATNN